MLSKMKMKTGQDNLTRSAGGLECVSLDSTMIIVLFRKHQGIYSTFSSIISTPRTLFIQQQYSAQRFISGSANEPINQHFGLLINPVMG